MSFENGLELRPDVFNNAQRSPFFSKLPGEVRNTIYKMVFTQTKFGRDVRRGQLTPSALRTCRQFCTEAGIFLYSCNKHEFRMDPDMVIYRGVPRIPSQFISRRNIGMIRHLELELLLPEQGHSGKISMDDITSMERHLRGICLCLSSSGAVLASMKIIVHNGFMLDPRAAFELLDTLKELRVKGEVRVLGIERFPLATIQEVKEITDEMVAPDVVHGDGSSQLTIRCMCQDLWDYINLCIEHVKDPEYCASDHEKAVALDKLEHALEVEGGERGEMHIPLGRKPMEVFEAALMSIEALYAELDQERFRDYHEAASKARERLFMRKAFREMVPHEVPDVYQFD